MCLTKRLLSEPLLSVGTGVQEFNRYPSTVNRQPCSCLMQWSDRELPAFGMSHRTAPPEPLFYVGTGAQPLSVPSLSTQNSRQIMLVITLFGQTIYSEQNDTFINA